MEPSASNSIWRPLSTSSSTSTSTSTQLAVKRQRTVLGVLSDNNAKDTVRGNKEIIKNPTSFKENVAPIVPLIPLNRVNSFGGTSTAPISAFPFPIFCDKNDEEVQFKQNSQKTRKNFGIPNSKSTPSLLAGEVCNVSDDINKDAEILSKLPKLQTNKRSLEREQSKRLPLGDIPMRTEMDLAAKDSPMMMDEMAASEENPMETSIIIQTESSSTKKGSISDKDHIDNVYMLDMEEYKEEIFNYLVEAQEKYLPKCNYMTKQPDITFPMRSILVDWLVEVSEEYKLQNETLYLAVNYVDRFLSIMSVQRAKLQLVGTACMFIAAKYEEIYPPDVGEFVYITDDTYSKKQVLRMEQLVLKVLNFDLAVPTILQFVTNFSKMVQSSVEAISLAQYLSELTLLEVERFLPYKHSVIAAASVALARHTLNLTAWPESIAQFTGIGLDDFKDCLVNIHEVFVTAPSLPQQAIREKYKGPKFQSVSGLQPTPIF